MSVENRRIKPTIILSIGLTITCITAGVFGGLYLHTSLKHNKLSEEFEVLSLEYELLYGNYIDLNQTYFILTGEYLELENNYNLLLDNYNSLLDDYNNLQEAYNELLELYNTLQTEYNDLLDNYNTLSIAYDYVCDAIRQSILPVQYSIFAEAVRRYYLPLYLDDTTEKTWYKGYAEFCRDMILHDSGQYNAFSIVSNAFSDALIFGNDTIYLAWYIMYWNFYPWIPYWDIDLTFDELWGIDVIVDWCIDEIDYEYDSIIIYGQENPTWDYPKFPVETAFRTMGDCEDQAILTAAYLESCGFETTIAISHDPDHPVYGSFYHGSLLVHIEDTYAFYLNYPFCNLWSLTSSDPYYPDFTWCWLDTTWDIPFGTVVPWVDDYEGSISLSVCSMAFCDIDGAVI